MINPDEIPVAFAIPAAIILWTICITGWARNYRKGQR